MKCQSWSPEKNKNITLFSAEFAHRVATAKQLLSQKETKYIHLGVVQ